MLIKCVLDFSKNYYELLRKLVLVQSYVREVFFLLFFYVYKIIKIIEFDEYKFKEIFIKSVIDNSVLLKSRDKERFVGLEEGGRFRVRLFSEYFFYLIFKDRLANRLRSVMVC